MPSLFEDTIGYSVAVLTPLYKRKPEHSKNIEIGYVHDLRGFFPRLRRADIRLNWYKNTTKIFLTVMQITKCANLKNVF